MSDVISILRARGQHGVGGLGPRKGYRHAPRPMTARGWYEQGVALEPTDPDAARVAYERALARDPALADAACNLGRLLHEAGDLPAAEATYRIALCADPGVAVYWFNLGVSVEDQGRRAEAIACYREAVALDPHLADAHFNLARLYERAAAHDLECARAAVRHWQAYRALRRTA